MPGRRRDYRITLRARFTGKPEYVINLMRFLAQNLRERMAG
ncbi:MAG: hypothetical protein R2912_01110 [Eubacteriales bacterium]